MTMASSFFPVLVIALASSTDGFSGLSGFGVRPSALQVTKARTPQSSSALQMSTWSDSKATKEYQEFLSSGLQTPEMKPDGPSVIIRPYDGFGSMELAESLYTMGMGDDYVVTPYEDLPQALGQSTEYPIYVTLPPSQLEAFIANLPPNYMDRCDDFVFFSGGLSFGNIEEVLQKYGFCRDTMTQVLISGLKYIPETRSVADLSVDLGTAGNGEGKRTGECSACGKWNGAIVQRMERSNVICKADFYREWRRQMWERSMFDAVFNLLGAVRSEPTSLRDVANYYGEEVSDLVWEMSSLLRGWKALTLTYGFEERLYGIAEGSNPDVQCSLDDEMFPYIWGNSVFTESSLFVEYLHYAQSDLGLLSQTQLPPMKAAGESKMRQGNLRADGVV